MHACAGALAASKAFTEAEPSEQAEHLQAATFTCSPGFLAMLCRAQESNSEEAKGASWQPDQQ